MQTFDAIVLGGGRGQRLGGVDKGALVVAGSTLLTRALVSVAGAERIVVAAPLDTQAAADPAWVARASAWVVEDPPGAGPVAAIDAALAHTTAPVVVLRACDMPLFDATAVTAVVAALGAADAALPVDAGGRRQYLSGAYRRSALDGALRALPTVANAAMRDVVNRLTIAEVATDPETTLDCDTWDDVERTRQILEGR